MSFGLVPTYFCIFFLFSFFNNIFLCDVNIVEMSSCIMTPNIKTFILKKSLLHSWIMFRSDELLLFSWCIISLGVKAYPRFRKQSSQLYSKILMNRSIN